MIRGEHHLHGRIVVDRTLDSLRAGDVLIARTTGRRVMVAATTDGWVRLGDGTSIPVVPGFVAHVERSWMP